MKTKLLLLFLFPLLLFGQKESEYLVFKNAMFSAKVASIDKFEKGLAEHNKKFHNTDLNGIRVYQIRNGKNTGKYIISSSTTWSSFDKRKTIDGHKEQWLADFMPYTQPDVTQTFWKFNADMSSFPKDFVVSTLVVDMIDIKRGKNKEVMDVIKQVSKVMKEKFPDDSFGIYSNEFPEPKAGRDVAMVFFIDSPAWFAIDSKFSEKFEEVHGKGSFDKAKDSWMENTKSTFREIWSFRADLSGISGEIKASPRQ